MTDQLDWHLEQAQCHLALAEHEGWPSHLEGKLQAVKRQLHWLRAELKEWQQTQPQESKDEPSPERREAGVPV